ncbi:hypothetical protein, partial [Isoptericola haloaureus]
SMKTTVLSATVAVPAHLLPGGESAMVDLRGAGRVTGPLLGEQAGGAPGGPGVHGAVDVSEHALAVPPAKTPRG